MIYLPCADPTSSGRESKENDKRTSTWSYPGNKTSKPTNTQRGKKETLLRVTHLHRVTSVLLPYFWHTLIFFFFLFHPLSSCFMRHHHHRQREEVVTIAHIGLHSKKRSKKKKTFFFPLGLSDLERNFPTTSPKYIKRNGRPRLSRTYVRKEDAVWRGGVQRISYSFHCLVVRCLNRATRLQTTPPERNRSAVLLCYLKVCSVEKQTKDSVASWRLLLFCFCLSQVKHNLVSTQILCKRILEWTRFLTFYFSVQHCRNFCSKRNE